MRFHYRYVPLGAVILALIVWACIVVAAFRRGSRVSVCPSCGSDRLRPSWPKAIDRYVMLRCGITPIRCEACLFRFYIRKPAGNSIRARGVP